jgi:hypothetical protein
MFLLCQQAMALDLVRSLFKIGVSVQVQPTYYSLSDLRAALKNQTFYFANLNRPIYAGVNLGAIPIYAASANKRARLSATLRSNPLKYRVRTSNIYGGWNDTYAIDFDWNRFYNEGGETGDLIFTRSNFTGADIVKIFSNWTHVAIAFDWHIKQVFESTPDTGVDLNYTSSSWGKVCYYTCKKIVTVDRPTIVNALNQAISLYRYKLYFPNILVSSGNESMLTKWSDKYDLDSMYCSKLVYHTYRNIVDLDTNNTSVYSPFLMDRTPAAPAFSWIGVSPDDLYYSSCLGPDFCYSNNLLNDGLYTAGIRQ